MSNLFKIDKHYVSDIDKFLQEKRQQFPLTASQSAEITKYKSVHFLRDHVKESHDNNFLEENF